MCVIVGTWVGGRGWVNESVSKAAHFATSHPCGYGYPLCSHAHAQTHTYTTTCAFSFASTTHRFPRLVRVRDDKSPEDATTAAQVADMYRQQAVVQANRADAGNDDDEA